MSSSTIQGESVSPGAACGPLHLPGRFKVAMESPSATMRAPAEEIDRFHQQVSALSREIKKSVAALESESLSAEAQIMQAHLAMLQDPEFHRQVHELVQGTRYAAEAAAEHVLERMAAMMRSSDSPVLAERAADLQDLAIRLKARLGSEVAYDLAAQLRGVRHPVVALPELLPSVVLEARSLGVAGFVVERGTGLSHGAILARSFGIPVVRVPSLAELESFAGQQVLVEGNTGEVFIAPGRRELAEHVEPLAVPAAIRPARGLPARLWVSIVDPEQLEGFDWSGVEGVGLYRTETLFLRHEQDFPSEQEQMQAYRRLFQLAGDRPVVVRTTDLGADKPVAHMSLGPQDNPYLGLRAHRLYRFHPEILVTQVRAILRAAAGNHRLRLMFPMIETIDQWRFVRGLVDRATASLREENLPHQVDFMQGVLVETPAAAWRFRSFLEVIDFASVGTNDLVQYLFAVERGAANVEDLYQPEHPVVLEVLAALADQARLAGKPLSICGEMAADPVLLPVLVGLGIEDLSLSPTAFGPIRQRLGSLDLDECHQLADSCKNAQTGEEVRAILDRTGMGLQARGGAVGRGKAIDPICNMVVSMEDNPHVLRIGGARHYFCCTGCMRQFLAARGGQASVKATSTTEAQGE